MTENLTKLSENLTIMTEYLTKLSESDLNLWDKFVGENG